MFLSRINLNYKSIRFETKTVLLQNAILSAIHLLAKRLKLLVDVDVVDNYCAPLCDFKMDTVDQIILFHII